MPKDIKAIYQAQAEDIAEQEFGKSFYNLDNDTQTRIYNKAMTQIDEELIFRAEKGELDR